MVTNRVGQPVTAGACPALFHDGSQRFVAWRPTGAAAVPSMAPDITHPSPP